jgi:carbamoyltransferase
MFNILGLSCFYHDSAATLVQDGKIIYSAQEERFTRKKHDSGFPTNAINFILKESKLSLQDIDAIVFYEKPFLKFERLLETHIAFAPKGFESFAISMPIWLKDKLFQKNKIFNFLKSIDSDFNDINKIKFSDHHLSHAASAFYPSNFSEAAILTIDGVGEFATTSIGIGKNNSIKILEEIHFPHSVGLLYSAFTYYLGFKVNSGEYKVMGLAPYGKPKYKDLILDYLIDIKKDGSFRLNMDFFNFATGLTMVNNKFEKLFQKKTRVNEKEPLTQFHMDIASSIQSVTEDILLKIVEYLSSKFKIKNLCMSGGVALNCVANGKILKSKFFDNIWIQPASGDAGGSLGAALNYWYGELGNAREILSTNKDDDKMKGSFLGPRFNNEDVETELKRLGANYHQYQFNELSKLVAKELNNGRAVGWFQDRAEFGPRALGNRSILADPRSEKMQKNLNMKVKFRESFRPFAPVIIRNKVSDYFKLDIASPYMLLVSEINENLKIPITEEQKNLFGIEKLNIKRSVIPSVTHVDYSSRIQTVSRHQNSKLYDLIQDFYEITGVPVLINTSFNIRSEPIVGSPQDAFKCFMGTNIDILVIQDFILYKNEQKIDLLKNYQNEFELD